MSTSDSANHTVSELNQEHRATTEPGVIPIIEHGAGQKGVNGANVVEPHHTTSIDLSQDPNRIKFAQVYSENE
jgi:hypothetical protein